MIPFRTLRARSPSHTVRQCSAGATGDHVPHATILLAGTSDEVGVRKILRGSSTDEISNRAHWAWLRASHCGHDRARDLAHPEPISLGCDRDGGAASPGGFRPAGELDHRATCADDRAADAPASAPWR